MSVVKNPCKIYVAGIPREIDERKMEEMFGEFGKLIALEFKGDFAFIEYDDGDSAEQAIRKYDGARLGNRHLIVEPFRYRGNDPRYRRPPPQNIKRGEYRLIVTNLGSRTTAQDLRDWCENHNLNTITVADVYSRHDMSKNEGVIEFRNRDDFYSCLRNLNNVKFGENVVRVFDERDYNRRRLQAHERDRTVDNFDLRQKISSGSPLNARLKNNNENERSHSPNHHNNHHNNDRRSTRNNNDKKDSSRDHEHNKNHKHHKRSRSRSRSHDNRRHKK